MFVACNNEPASSGSGSVTCTLNGIIYDAETLTPIKGASVSNGTQSTQTDKNGSFALENVAPGSYTISIVKDGYVMEVIEDVLVDSGRFYNRELSDEDKAMLAKLISEGAEIDDYYAEILFGGERDVDYDDRNPDIDSIGDSATYGQTIFAVGLTPANAVLEGTIDVVFADKSAYDIPEGVGIIAICVNQPVANNQEPEIIRTYKTTVGKAGSFRFEKIMPGFYYLAVDPMSITLNGVTIEVDGHLFNGEGEGAIVLNGSGTTNTLHVPAPAEIIEDPFKFKVVSVKAIDRSEIPVSNGSRDLIPDVSMKAGQAICIEFNKPIDKDADRTMFFFMSEATQVTGYTQYLIVNGDNGNGYAYVWHDSINSAEDLELVYSVSSFDKGDYLNGVLEIDYAYQLTIDSTNLYGYDYDNNLRNGVFKADQPIEIVFDKEIPENSTVEGILLKYGALYNPSIEIPVTFEYDGKVLRAYAPIEYRCENFGDLAANDFWYTLKFKITTNEDIVIYNTENGLFLPKVTNLLLIGEEGDCITFKTAGLRLLSIPEYIDPNDEFYAVFNQSLDGNTATAFLTSYYDNDKFSVIPLNCKIDDNIITASLDEGTALHPDFTYSVTCIVTTEYEIEEIDDHVLFHFTTPKFQVGSEFDELFHNGLDDFKVVGDKYDWDSEVVSFSWTSLGKFLGQGQVYDLYMRMIDDEGEEIQGWDQVASFNEIEYFEYTFRDKEIKKDCAVLGQDPRDLLYGRCAQFILVSYDEDGLMIQSPVRTIQDMVGPKMTSAKPYIEPGITTYAYLNEHPVIFTLDTNEPIDSVKEEDVVVGGAHPEYFEVTWKMVDADSAGFTVKAVNAPVQATYAEGDLELTITLRDTSYNETEQVLDFKGQDL